MRALVEHRLVQHPGALPVRAYRHQEEFERAQPVVLEPIGTLREVLLSGVAEQQGERPRLLLVETGNLDQLDFQRLGAVVDPERLTHVAGEGFFFVT